MVKLLMFTFLALSLFSSTVVGKVYDRTISVGVSSKSTNNYSDSGVHKLISEMIVALDGATQTKSKIVFRPFSRSLKETASGQADVHIPIIRSENTPPPKGLVYLNGVNFPPVAFVIYSRKKNAIDVNEIATVKLIEVEAGHQVFFPFKVNETNCVSCSLDKLLVGRINALIVAADVVDPMLKQDKYKNVHRALYKFFPITVLAPANKNNEPVRQYFIEGAKRLSERNALPKGLTPRDAYVNWQP